MLMFQKLRQTIIIKAISNLLQIVKSLFRKLTKFSIPNKFPKGIVADPMGVTLVKHILAADKATPASHNIKVKVEETDLHQHLVEQGYPTHKRNKRIHLEMQHTNPNITVKISVYPKTVFIDIGCTDEPFACTPNDRKRLACLLNEIRQFIYEQSCHRAVIPEIGKWWHVQHHRNQDGNLTYDGKTFHILLEDELGSITRAYSKSFPDGHTIVRLEQIRTNKTPMREFLKGMK